MGSPEKPQTFRSADYLEFIRRQPCVICSGTRCEPHHIWKGTDGGTGKKPSDCYTVPLCNLHHTEVHQYGTETFYKRAGLKQKHFLDITHTLLIRFMKEFLLDLQKRGIIK